MIARPWWPVAAWAAVILVLTSWPNPQLPDAPAGSDKAVHGGLYLVLGILSARALRLQGLLRIGHVMATLVALLLFGVLDEGHQRWVPGRAADVADWGADAVGATLGLLFSLAAAPRRRESSS